MEATTTWQQIRVFSMPHLIFSLLQETSVKGDLASSDFLQWFYLGIGLKIARNESKHFLQPIFSNFLDSFSLCFGLFERNGANSEKYFSSGPVHPISINL